MWQYTSKTVNSDGETVLQRMPIYKVIGADDSYFVTMTTTIPLDVPDKSGSKQDHVSVITHSGKIKVLTTDTYNEYIKEHYITPDMAGTTSTLRFHFDDEDKNILRVSYCNEITNIWIDEVWIRVQPLE